MAKPRETEEMLTEHELGKIAQWMTGEDKPLQAIRVALMGYAEQMILFYQPTVQCMEDKCGLAFHAFHMRLGEEIPLSWEHEQDYMQWEAAVTNLPELERITLYLNSNA